MSELYLINRPR